MSNVTEVATDYTLGARKVKPPVFVFVLILAISLVSAALYKSGETRYGTTKEAYDSYLEGYQHLISHKRELATTSLNHALELDPDFALAHAALAFVQSRGFEGQAARTSITVADSLCQFIEDDVNRCKVQLFMLLSGPVEHLNADSLITFLEGKAPSDELVLLYQAAIIEDVDSKAESFTRLLEENPNHSLAHNQLGYIAARNGDFEKAEKHIKKYIYLAPDLANPHDSLGEIYMHWGRYEDAIHEFQLALSLQKNFPESVDKLAEVSVRMGQIQRGLEILADLRSSGEGTDIPEWVDARRIEILRDSGLDSYLDEAYSSYISTYPTRLRSAVLRAVLYKRHGAREMALTLIDSVYSKHPELSHNNTFRAVLADLVDDHPAAAREWEQVINTGLVKNSEYQLLFEYIQLARKMVQTGRHQEALETARKILRINPRHIEFLVIRAECAATVGEIYEARETISQARSMLKSADRNHPAHARLAVLESVIAHRNTP